MKSKTKLLSLLLTLVMVLFAFGNTAYALAQDTKAQASGYEELKGQVKDGREVFSFNLPEKQKASVKSLKKALRLAPVRLPAQTDTSVEFITKGLNNGTFDWDALPDKSFNLVAKWTTKDGQTHEKKVGPITEAGTKEFNIGWPTDGTMVGTASLDAEYLGNIKIRVDFSSSTAPGSAGKLHFRIRLTELANPIVNVQYVDPYGKALKANDLPTGNMPAITSEQLTDVSLPLPAKDAELNVRGSDDLDEDQLNAAVDGIEYKVDGKGHGDKLTLGGKEYKIDLSEKSAKNPTTLSMVYQADVLVPDRDNGKYPPVPNGYKRLTFNANQPAEGQTAAVNGRFNDLGEKVKVIDVKDGVKYDNESLKTEIAKLKPVALNAQDTPDQSKVFDKWNPAVPTDATAVDTKTYNATYTDKYSNKDVIPYVPADKENPTNPDDTNVPTTDKDGKTVDKSLYDIV
ncbi:MAG: hypothetical protein KIB49_03365, partial [Clostridiales bacterium]|nr:hypothetical protein [Clostridiales bacterium]